MGFVQVGLGARGGFGRMEGSEFLTSKSGDDHRNTAIDVRISCSDNQLMQI